tara:strand:+ start:579 stop:827 length:249 start_codon:yes stop_codon:yes gene_type:complete
MSPEHSHGGDYDPTLYPEIEQVIRTIEIMSNFIKANRIHMDEAVLWKDEEAEAEFWRVHDILEDDVRLARHNMKIIYQGYLR